MVVASADFAVGVRMYLAMVKLLDGKSLLNVEGRMLSGLQEISLMKFLPMIAV